MTFADRIYANVTIGAGGSDPAKRFVNQPDLEIAGWKYFLRSGGGIDNYAEWGCPNFFFNNVGGVTANAGGTIGWYDFGQMVHARDGVKGRNPKLPWLAKGFDTAWSLFAKARANRGQTVRCVPYIGTGSASTDPQLDPAKTTIVQRMDYRADALRQLIPCGSIGFDSLTQLSPDSEHGRYIQSLAAGGVEIYGEGYPTKDNPWTADFNVYCSDDNYNQRTWGAGNEHKDDGGWGVPEESIKGKLVIIRDSQSEASGESTEAFARRHLAAGRCVCLPIYDLMARGVKLKDLNPEQ
jgi:hypothetical protein